MINYTQHGEIVRGSQWPPSGKPLRVRLHSTDGWAGADGWDWKMAISRTLRAGTPDLVLDAASVVVDGEYCTVQFQATSTETAALPGSGSQELRVEVYSDDGTPDDPSYYDHAQGRVAVRDPAGEG